MADEQLIKPRELPAATTVFADDAIMTDDGVTVGKATPVQIVNAGAPVPTEAEAIAGTDNSKRMTPLTVKQVLDSVTAPSVMRAAAWAESDSPPDPGIPGSQSAKSWAEEAKSTAEIMEKASQQDQYSLTLSAGQTVIDEDADGNPIIVTDVADVYIDGFLLSPGVDYDINGSGHPVLLKEWDAGRVVRVNLIPNYSSPTSKSTETPPSASLRFFAAEPYDSVAAVLNSKQITAELIGSTILTKPGVAYKLVLPAEGVILNDAGSVGLKVVTPGRVSVESLGVDMTGVKDAYPVLQAALEKGIRFSAGAGTIYLSEPLKPTLANSLLSWHGICKIPHKENEVTGLTRIYAPNGFAANPQGQHIEQRRNMDLWGLDIFGENADTAVGIDGSWGGSMLDCRMTRFNRILDNGYAYLCVYRGNLFNHSTLGLRLGDTNACVFTENSLGSSMESQFTNYGGASNNAYPFIYTNNNHNFGGAFTGGVTLSTPILATGNYFEAFGSGYLKTTPMVQIIARRFAFPTIIFEQNHLNGQSKMDHAISLVSDNASGTECIASRMKGNWIKGFTAPAIRIGGVDGFYPGVSGVDFGGVAGNAVDNGHIAYASGGEVAQKDCAMLTYTGTLSFTGTTWVSIPVTVAKGYLQAGPKLRPRRSYVVVANVSIQYTAAVQNVGVRIALNGTPVVTQRVTLPAYVGTTGANTLNVPITAFINASEIGAGDLRIQVQEGTVNCNISQAVVTVNELDNYGGFTLL